MSQHNQKTINEKIKLSGVGLHNGIKANLIVHPAKENFGIKFSRIDKDKENLIDAKYSNVIEPILCTKIKTKMGSLSQLLSI